MPEVDIARIIVQYFKDLKHDVYQEVCFSTQGHVADIVTVYNKIVTIIEVKTSLSLALLEQCHYWLGYVNYIYACVPKNNRSNFHYKIFEDYGIGVLNIHKHEYNNEYNIYESAKPKFYRKTRSDHVLNTLTEEHKTFAEAGNSDRKFFSPFKSTCKNVLKYVACNNGCSLKQLVENINHHYANTTSARGALYQWIKQGLIPGIKYVKDGKFIKIYLINSKEI